jgi:Flp pilus assembly protein TadD
VQPAGVQRSPMELVHEADGLVHVGDIQQATEIMSKALAIAPRDPAILTAFGSMLAEVGNVDKAVVTLRKAIRLEPDSGYEKYMCAYTAYTAYTDATNE